MEFHGAKAALFIGDHLLVILRDNKPDILFPAHWDFPGGGREGNEKAFETLSREVLEEVGLPLTENTVVWRRAFAAAHHPGQSVWFFVVRLPATAKQNIVFGDEGLCWALMTPDQFNTLSNAVPSLASRLRIALVSEGADG